MGNSVIGGSGCSLTRSFALNVTTAFSIAFAAKWAAAVTGTFPSPFSAFNPTLDFWTAFQDDAANGDDIEVEYKTGASTNTDVAIGSNASLVGRWIHFCYTYNVGSGAQSIYCLIEGFNPASPSFLITPSRATTTALVPVSLDVFTDSVSDFFLNGKIAHFIVCPLELTQAQAIAQFQQRAPISAIVAGGAYTYLDCQNAASVQLDLGTTATNFTRAGSFTDSQEQPIEWQRRPVIFSAANF